jgi:hypothetical protein
MVRVTILGAITSMVLWACGSTQHSGLTLHAPRAAHGRYRRCLNRRVGGVRHAWDSVRAELPSAQSDASSPRQASGSDYASPKGGTLSVDDNGGGTLTLVCH